MAEPAVNFGFRRPAEPDRIWISSGYRLQLIGNGIEKAVSVNELRSKMGYRSGVHPGWGWCR